MPLEEVVEGALVAHINRTDVVTHEDTDVFVGYLLTGHPGRVTDPMEGQHVLVAWYGLEDEDVSQVVGWGSVGGRLSLAALAPQEYNRRCAVIDQRGLDAQDAFEG